VLRSLTLLRQADYNLPGPCIDAVYMTQPTESRSFADLALTAFVERLASGRRVLWLGDPSTGAPERIASVAHSVRVLDTTGRGRRRRGGNARVSLYRPGPLELESGAYDLAVVPDITTLEDPAARVRDLAGILGDGVLLAGVQVGRDPDGAFQTLDDALDGAFREVRMLGQARFSAHAVADFDAERHDVVYVDGSLLGEDTGEVDRYLALAADELPALEPYTIVQIPEVGRGENTSELETQLAGRAREVDALRDELERSEARLEQAQARLVSTEGDLAEARAQLRRAKEEPPAAPPTPQPEPQPEPKKPAEDLSGDVVALEKKLRERGAEVLRLEREQRRMTGVLRDAVEELREHQLGRRGDVARGAALDARAAEVAASFEVDELRGRLLDADLRFAELEGTVRGLRARAAELKEMRAIAEARAQLYEADVQAAREETRRARAELAEAREALELEMLKSRGPSSVGTEPARVEDARLETLEASERRLSARVGTLSGQLMAARDLALQAKEERDRARAETLGLTAQVSALETRMEGLRLGYEMRIAMLTRDAEEAIQATGTDAAIEEELGRVRTELQSLRGERDGLRMRLADVEASRPEVSASGDALDELDRLRAEVESLRGESGALTLRLAELETSHETEGAKARDLASALAARDALVTRLQMDLAEEEQQGRLADDKRARLREENARLRDALLEASGAVDAKDAAEKRAEILQQELTRALTEGGALDAERERAEALEEELSQTRERAEAIRAAHDETVTALKDLRAMLDAVRASGSDKTVRSDITAAGMEAPDGERDQVLRLEREIGDKDTLLRSLTAQLEERNDRIRAMERRLAQERPSGSGDASEAQLMELEERASRLSEELEHERRTRAELEAQMTRLRDRPDAATELRRLESELRSRESALETARSRASVFERDVASLRSVCAETRQGLEELLGDATSTGDPATAERLGALLSVLSRF